MLNGVTVILCVWWALLLVLGLDINCLKWFLIIEEVS